MLFSAVLHASASLRMALCKASSYSSLTGRSRLSLPASGLMFRPEQQFSLTSRILDRLTITATFKEQLGRCMS